MKLSNVENPERLPIENLIHAHVNQVREDHGLERVSMDKKLRDVARGHSERMAAQQFFSHKTPDGEEPSDRYQKHGYQFKRCGENIARVPYKTPMMNGENKLQYDTPPEVACGVVEGWMNSEGHRENMLSSEWEVEGVGVKIKQKPRVIRVYATQNFSKKRVGTFQNGQKETEW